MNFSDADLAENEKYRDNDLIQNQHASSEYIDIQKKEYCKYIGDRLQGKFTKGMIYAKIYDDTMLCIIIDNANTASAYLKNSDTYLKSFIPITYQDWLNDWYTNITKS
jgi:hypothetical protein